MSNAPKTIIAGVDFSPASATLLKHAAKMAMEAGARLLAVHVLDSSRVKHWLVSRPNKVDNSKLKSHAVSKLDKLIADESVDSKLITTMVLEGKPAQALRDLAQQENADILVIAANDLTKKRLGSIASRCVRLVKCDVLVLRDWQERDFKEIVACIDLSSTSNPVITRAAAEARMYGSTLELVHVIYPPERDAWGELLDDEVPEEMYERVRLEARGEMHKVLKAHEEELTGIEYKATILESTVPSVALTNHIADTEADMAVLGTKEHSKLGAFFLGTNAERLLHDVPVSVLAVRS